LKLHIKIIREDNPTPSVKYHYGYYDVDNSFIHHREDGPAIIYNNGDKYWYQNDKPHREDGPAVEYANGYKVWYYRHKRVKVSSQEEFEKAIKYLNF
jgi:hypothetical protein